jgi:tRNA (guanine37-N1)-methyltransferase
MKFDIISIFPDYFHSPLCFGILKIAQEKNIIKIRITNPRDFTKDGVVDDYQFGGGAGMVMKAEPLLEAIDRVKTKSSSLIMLTPQGKRLNQRMVTELTGKKHVILICGRYKGIDERVNEIYNPMQVSVGDYVLSGGEIGALVIIESVTRLLPGSMGNIDSADTDSFQQDLLEAPIYTRPHVYQKLTVPEVLRSGHHRLVARWRRKESLSRTLKNKPEIIPHGSFSKKDFEILLEVINGKDS